MKKIYFLLAFTLIATSLPAQEIPNFMIGNISVDTDGETVTVSFDAEVGRKAARRGVTMIYAPVIAGGDYRVSLTPVVVQGRHADRDWTRHEWAAGQNMRFREAIYADNGERLTYRAEVPFQEWMHNARIEIETVTAGCCSSMTCLTHLATNILPAPEPEPEPIPEPEPLIEVPTATVVEVLAEAFPFVLPASGADANNPFMFYDEDRENALTVYYRVNSYSIDEDYAGNRHTLANLMAAIDILQASEEYEVEKVVVAGFASPDGPFELNDRLAWERAVSVKLYIMDNSGIPDGRILISNGSADWRGLRHLVARDPNVPGQRQVLDIIDNHPIWDSRTRTGRQTLIRNLNGGRTFRYLADNIFPKLRNGAFIRIYWQPAEPGPQTGPRK